MLTASLICSFWPATGGATSDQRNDPPSARPPLFHRISTRQRRSDDPSCAGEDEDDLCSVVVGQVHAATLASWLSSISTTCQRVS